MTFLVKYPHILWLHPLHTVFSCPVFLQAPILALLTLGGFLGLVAMLYVLDRPRFAGFPGHQLQQGHLLCDPRVI